jgi:hypothetical protein
MTLPNFFVVGAARSATDAVYSYLKQHPDVYMSPVKETNFFVFYGDRVKYCGPGDQEALRSCYVPNMDAYQALFRPAQDATARGEASPWYLYMRDTPGRIKQHVPQAKLIAILRNPIDRAYSSFCMLHRDNREPLTNFVTALAQEPRRISANWEPIWHYRAMSLYAEQIRRYQQTFGPDQLRIYLYDDLERDAQSVVRDMFGFLGVDTGFTPNTSTRPNQSYVPRNQRLHAFLAGQNSAKSLIKPLVPLGLRQRLKARLMATNAAGTSVSPGVRERLLPAFRADIEQLQALIDRDLSSWLVAG